MSEGPSEAELLIEFARAAAKAQEIERILSDTLVAYAVHKDTKDRSFEKIAEEIDGLSLGQLQKRYLTTLGKNAHDQGFQEMFRTINDERIFLMHKFFQSFPVEKLNGNEKAAIRLKKIDDTLSAGRDMLRNAFVGALANGKIPPTKLRKVLKFLVEHRRKAKVSELFYEIRA